MLNKLVIARLKQKRLGLTRTKSTLEMRIALKALFTFSGIFFQRQVTSF